MRRLLSFLIVGLAGLAATVSCNVGLESIPQPSKHTVYFTTSENSPVTKTGITIDNTTVTPDWRLTKAENVHLFEYQAANTVSVGEDVEIAIAADNLTASFKADFPEDMTIVVDPTDPELDGAKGGSRGAKGSGSYTYAAVIAQQGEAKDLKFVVPAVQYPDPNTLIDPDADFLIGYNSTVFTDPHDFEENVVDLYFDRPVALGRLSLTNFVGTDESVKSVTIAAQGGMSGSAGLGDINFAKASVNFKADTEGGITLSYGKNGQAVSDGAFVAYFVSLPGSVTLTSIEVVTDQFVYTKTFDGGKTLALSNESFKSLKLDLSTAVREAATPESNTWYKASVLEDGIDYLIVSQGMALKNNGSKAVVAAQSVEIVDGTISLEETDGIIWTANANSEFTEYGTHTLTNGTEHLWRHSDNGTFTLEANNEAITKYMVWNYDGEYLWNISIYTGSGSASVSDYYAYYSNGWKISTTKTPATLYTTRAPQELSFSPAASAEYDLATGSWTVVVPTLTGAYTPVTYALSDDSNPAVATVDADGTVHPLSKGTVKIVATAAGNAQYQAAVASYTLRVIDSSSTTPVWYKAEEIEDGETYLIISNGYALKNDGSSAGAAINLGVSGDSFEYEADETVIWTATASSGKFRLGNGGQVLRISTSSSSYGGGTTTTFQIGTASSTESNNQWELNAQALLMISSNYFYYSTSQSKWSLSTSASDTHTGYLYGLHAGRQAQTLAFSATSVDFDIAGGAAFTAPTLSGAQTDVTYSSSNSAVATVDDTSGAVTIVGTGTAVITASAKGTNEFKPATATYTIHVIDSSIGPKTYVRVTSASNLVVGAKYLLVYESTPSVFKPILNGSTFKKTADNVQSVTISNHSITSAELVDCELTLTEGYYLYVEPADRYVYPLFDGNQTTSLEAESSPSHNLTVTINSDGTAKITNAASTASSFTWSTRNSYFSSSSSATAASNVCLYKEDDGSNPGGGDDPQPPTPSGTTYSPASSIVAGQEYLIVSNGKALQNNSGSAGTYDVTISNNQIQIDAPSTILWKAELDSENKINLTNGSSYLRRPSSGSSVINSSASSTKDNNQWNYSASEEHLYLVHTSSNGSTTTYYLSLSGSTWSISTNSGSITLYTANPGSNPGGGDDPEPPTPSANTYNLINSLSELESGATYLIVSSDSGNYNGNDHKTLFAGDQDGTTVSVSASNGTITGAYSAYEFVITKKSDSDYSLLGPNGYVTGNSGTNYTRYIQVSNSEVTMSLTNATELKAASSGDGLVSNAFYFYYTKNSSKEVLYLNADSKYKIGGSGRKYGVYLYKKTDNP